jgi:hypothetical protein
MPYTNSHITLAKRTGQTIAPLRLLDDSLWSIQASTRHMCHPRAHYAFTTYTAVELWILEGDEPAAWEPWRVRGDEKHYGWLPVSLVDEEIQRRGLRLHGNRPLAND